MMMMIMIMCLLVVWVVPVEYRGQYYAAAGRRPHSRGNSQVEDIASLYLELSLSLPLSLFLSNFYKNYNIHHPLLLLLKLTPRGSLCASPLLSLNSPLSLSLPLSLSNFLDIKLLNFRNRALGSPFPLRSLLGAGPLDLAGWFRLILEQFYNLKYLTWSPEIEGVFRSESF